MTATPADLLAGQDALRRGAWGEARTCLQASVAAGDSAAAEEALGLAAWWLDDAALTFQAREKAYALYREQDDARGAARVAIWLVWDNLAFRGDFAVARGWLERARRLLADQHNSAEFGWLLIREGEVALFRGHDPNGAIASAAAAAKLGREVGDQAVEFTALALEGLARVSIGDVADGLRRLDEATLAATAGEVKEPHAVGLVCCWQIFACERVRDYDRAAQWCARAAEFSRRWGLRPLSAVCRTQYAGVLIWRGEWDSAEAELTAAARELAGARPGMTEPAFARLGELRLRQGLFDDAERLFEQSSSQPQARLGMATLMLERGNAAESVELVDEFLSGLAPTERTARASALEICARANTVRGDVAAAQRRLEELQAVADALGTDPVAASAAAMRGLLLREQGDVASAARSLETACELFARSGAPFETARTRLDLAEMLRALGRNEAAERQARLALDALESLGARHEAARAKHFLDGEPAQAKKSSARATLTARQVEVLRLVAQGMSNAAIARRLDLSEHTVKRHIANLLTKLGLSSRAAAVAYAAREGLL